jgi:hypothetical protein
MPDTRHDAAILALADRVLPRVIETVESIIFVKSPMDPVDLWNRGVDSECAGVPLPADPMTTSDFYIIFDGVRNSEDSVCDSYRNLAAQSETCAHDLFPFNPRAGRYRSSLS